MLRDIFWSSPVLEGSWRWNRIKNKPMQSPWHLAERRDKQADRWRNTGESWRFRLWLGCRVSSWLVCRAPLGPLLRPESCFKSWTKGGGQQAGAEIQSRAREREQPADTTTAESGRNGAKSGCRPHLMKHCKYNRQPTLTSRLLCRLLWKQHMLTHTRFYFTFDSCLYSISFTGDNAFPWKQDRPVPARSNPLANADGLWLAAFSCSCIWLNRSLRNNDTCWASERHRGKLKSFPRTVERLRTWAQSGTEINENKWCVWQHLVPIRPYIRRISKINSSYTVLDDSQTCWKGKRYTHLYLLTGLFCALPTLSRPMVLSPPVCAAASDWLILNLFA